MVSHDIWPGERPLLAFVSSVMRPDLEWARAATVSALSDNPALVPWAFEFTPASSHAADDTYLAKVREADFVIWLVGAETTQPVRHELAEAIAANSRLWVILLPCDERDEATETLLTEVRSRAKWGEAANALQLRELLTLTFTDEVIRALRDTPGLTRLALLEQTGRASRARMIDRWQAAGVPRAEAIAFADDSAIGAPRGDLLPTSDRPVRILTADVGAGKSLVAERTLQEGLKSAFERASAPIPIFTRARDVQGALEAALLAASAGLGDPRQQGAYVIVDGLDEIPRSAAIQLIQEARIVAEAFPNTRLLMTSRPMAILSGDEDVTKLPLLSEGEARALVGRVAGQEVTPGAAASWPSALEDAVTRPLFAILLGLERRAGAGQPPSTGALLGSLVERAIDPERAADALPWLQRLGVLLTDRGGGYVRTAEVGDHQGRLAVRNSRVVLEHGHRGGFRVANSDAVVRGAKSSGRSSTC